jgi:branched-subunit amino acid aminotransferase/4-amino-4-deoxychorismate lyase
VEERNLTLAEAKCADEVFLTSSMRHVQGIERWDDLNLTRRARSPTLIRRLSPSD